MNLINGNLTSMSPKINMSSSWLNNVVRSSKNAAVIIPPIHVIISGVNPCEVCRQNSRQSSINTATWSRVTLSIATRTWRSRPSWVYDGWRSSVQRHRMRSRRTMIHSSIYSRLFHWWRPTSRNHTWVSVSMSLSSPSFSLPLCLCLSLSLTPCVVIQMQYVSVSIWVSAYAI